jgi:hypothetical protein
MEQQSFANLLKDVQKRYQDAVLHNKEPDEKLRADIEAIREGLTDETSRQMFNAIFELIEYDGELDRALSEKKKKPS